MSIPTKRVRRIEDGAEAVINASDFDPALHQDLAAADEPAPAPKPKAKAVKPAPAPEPDVQIDDEDTGV